MAAPETASCRYDQTRGALRPSLSLAMGTELGGCPRKARGSAPVPGDGHQSRPSTTELLICWAPGTGGRLGWQGGAWRGRKSKIKRCILAFISSLEQYLWPPCQAITSQGQGHARTLQRPGGRAAGGNFLAGERPQTRAPRLGWGLVTPQGAPRPSSSVTPLRPWHRPLCK